MIQWLPLWRGIPVPKTQATLVNLPASSLLYGCQSWAYYANGWQVIMLTPFCEVLDKTVLMAFPNSLFTASKSHQGTLNRARLIHYISLRPVLMIQSLFFHGFKQPLLFLTEARTSFLCPSFLPCSHTSLDSFPCYHFPYFLFFPSSSFLPFIFSSFLPSFLLSLLPSFLPFSLPDSHYTHLQLHPAHGSHVFALIKGARSQDLRVDPPRGRRPLSQL